MQFTKQGMMAVDPAEVDMEASGQYAHSGSKKNTRVATKDVRSGGGGNQHMTAQPMPGQMHQHMPQHHMMQGGPGTPMNQRGGVQGQNVMRGVSSPMVGSPGVMGTPMHGNMSTGSLPGSSQRGQGMLPPVMVGTPAPYMQSPSTPNAGHYGQPMTPSSTPLVQRNLRMSNMDAPMTPGGASSGNLFSDDSQPLGTGVDDASSALGSDDEDESKSKNKRGKPKNRGNRKKDDDDNLFGDEDPQTAGYNAAIAIWKTVEAFFADFTDEDFKFVSVDGKDDAFRIPNLGKKSVLAQHSAQQHHPSLLHQSQSDMLDIAPKVEGGAFGGPNGPSFMTRLISSLVEESSIASIPHWIQRPPLQDAPIPPTEQDPMFGLVSQQEAEFIEARLKKELTLLGLFGDAEPSSSTPANGLASSSSGASGQSGGASGSGTPYKETRSATAAAAAAERDAAEPDDDEVLSELKRLQAKLRAQVEVNNATKVLLRQQMEAANGSRKKAKEERDALSKLESHYVGLHKAIIKKKKKPNAKQAAAAAAAAAKAANAASSTSNAPKPESSS